MKTSVCATARRFTPTPAPTAKTFQVRQIISGEVEVTAGGQTRDVTDADGDLVPHGPRMTPIDEATRLTGMPGGPYEACFMDDSGA